MFAVWIWRFLWNTINILFYWFPQMATVCFHQPAWSKSFMMHRLYVCYCVQDHFHLPQLIDGVHYFCSSHTLSNSLNACWRYLGFSCCFSVSAQDHSTTPASGCISTWVLKVHPLKLLTCLSLKSEGLFTQRKTGECSRALQRRSRCLFSLFCILCGLWHQEHLHLTAGVSDSFLLGTTSAWRLSSKGRI